MEGLQPGDIVVVASEEIIPIDGVIVERACSIDQHILTGEAQPVEKGVGDSVFAFTIILSGKIYIRTDESGQNTVAAQINNVLTDMKSHVEQTELNADKINDQWALPMLLLSAPFLLSGRVPQGINILVAGPTTGLRITSPVTLLNFLKILSGHHIFVKDGRALKLLTEIDTIVFDKTGTLTLNTPSVGNVYSLGQCSKDTILSYAAAAEQRQSHPIAQAILEEAYNRQLILPVIDDSHYELGLGIKAMFDGKKVLVRSMSFIAGEGIRIPRELKTIQEISHHQGYSLVIAAIGNQLGAIELHPTIRPEAPDVIKKLSKNYNLYIISGDHKEPTRKMAETLNIDHYFAEVLPQDKACLIKKLKREGKSICFVGDGINDSVALKEADVSISLEGASTIAVNTANIILTKGTLKELPLLFEVMQEFKQNSTHSKLISAIPNTLCLIGTLFLGWGPAIGLSIYTFRAFNDRNASLAEIRRRAIDAYKMGKGSQADIASSYRVDLRTFQRGLSRFNETGQTAPRPRGHRQALYSRKQLKALAQLGGKHPDATLEELKNMSGVKGSIMAVQRALNRLGCRYKRNASRQRARPGRCKSLEKAVDPRGGQT